ncbi:hypothetical protein SmJEL517_g00164 [Synchytrium microbalum]|uniref:Amino acid transporter transmembrane domain-containing protein n=1 Tax=Synchytrium microbalum TaxID=1806994 RepID=A0A507CAP4_9FUNG|nr:uncharacterized protein SmJEL517_g00164 [Synchytrium microbalum]TPX38127.1 hypothetical protein SmJEL517_g00164 [Synchytrium microbalum]
MNSTLIVRPSSRMSQRVSLQEDGVEPLLSRENGIVQSPAQIATISASSLDDDEYTQNGLQDFDLELDDELGEKHHKSTPLEALYHLVCVIIGTGILALPYAMRQSGWIGLFIILFSAIVNDSTGRMLVSCLYHQPGHRLTSYADIGQAAFGQRGRLWVVVFYRSALGGITTLYVVLAGTNAANGLGWMSTRVWICLFSIIVMVPVLILKSLKEVAVVSLLATLVSVIVVIVIILAGISQIAETGGAESNIVNLVGFPSALASVSFSFGGNFIYPDVEASLQEPSTFPSVLRKAMIIVCSIYLLIAITGYAAWGTASSSPILDNLTPNSPGKILATISITLHVLLACPVLISTLTNDIERSWKCPVWLSPVGWSALKARVSLRMGLAACISALAVSVPYFTDWVEVMGAIANTALVFIFPVVFYYQLNGWDGRSWREWAWTISILTVGVVGGTIGGINALINLGRHLIYGNL